MKILVTGGAGYIGSVLCPKLISLGHEVTVIDRLDFGIHSMLPVLDKINLIKADMRVDSELSQALKGQDAIIHLAAIVGFPECSKDPIEAESINVGCTRKLLRLKSKDQMLVYASTGSVYGKLDSDCTEESPTEPLSVYGKTKLESEKMVLADGGVAFRYATLFGLSPCMRFDILVNDFTLKAVKDGYVVLYQDSAKRTFLHVDDAVRTQILALNNYGDMCGKVFNAGHESMNLTKREVAIEIKKHVSNFYIHVAPIGTDSDARDYRVDYTKIRTAGFSAVTTISQAIPGIMKCAKFLSSHSNWRISNVY